MDFQSTLINDINLWINNRKITAHEKCEGMKMQFTMLGKKNAQIEKNIKGIQSEWFQFLEDIHF